MPSASFNLGNGSTVRPAYGQKESVLFTSAWAAANRWWMRFITSAGNFSVGAEEDADGNPVLAGTTPTFGVAIGGRVFLANGEKMNFSDNNDPTGWFEQNPGAGFIWLLKNYGGQDGLVSLASYQGYVAAFLRHSIQIWIPNGDPTQFQLKQILSNIGTNYKFSVQSIGDYDVLFLSDTGIRSLRVRDQSLNAFTVDIGSPVDLLVQADIEAGVGVPLSIVEPTAKRYWLYLRDKIYVLSLFDDIRAWSQYEPTFQLETVVDPDAVEYNEGGSVGYSGIVLDQLYYWTKGADDISFTCGSTTLTASGYFTADDSTAVGLGTPGGGVAVTSTLIGYSHVAFTPSRFVLKDDTVYCRANDGTDDRLISYGGGEYDFTIASVKTPYLSLKSPSTMKYAQGYDALVTGPWTVAISMDQASGSFEAADSVPSSTPGGGYIGLRASGPFAAFYFTTPNNSARRSVLSAIDLIFHAGQTN